MEYASGDRVLLLDHPSNKERIGTVITLKKGYAPVRTRDPSIGAWLIEEDPGYYYFENEFRLATSEDEIDEIAVRVHYWRHRL